MPNTQFSIGGSTLLNEASLGSPFSYGVSWMAHEDTLPDVVFGADTVSMSIEPKTHTLSGVMEYVPNSPAFSLGSPVLVQNLYGTNLRQVPRFSMGGSIPSFEDPDIRFKVSTVALSLNPSTVDLKEQIQSGLVSISLNPLASTTSGDESLSPPGIDLTPGDRDLNMSISISI